MMDKKIAEIFFSPSGIAVIGASQDPSKLGYALARNITECGYRGEIHYVNRRGGKLFGQPIYTAVDKVPDPVDFAVLLIPAQFVPSVLVDCGQRGIKGAIIAAGGFKEVGPEGAALERECLDIAQSYRMHLLGPNCVGLIDTHLPLNATFLAQPGPPKGDLALLSQSGAICAAVIDWARGQDLGFSRLVSLGNQADLNETDLLSLTALDPNTKVVTMYLEGIKNGRRFLQVVPEITRQKPVVALKVGKSTSGQRAAASHTGSLAGQDHAYDAAFRRCGVIRVRSSVELFDWARALAWCPVPNGHATAILTNSGGPGVTAADSLEEHGLTLAALSPETIRNLRSFLPPVASIQNPVDLLASATPGQYAKCLQLLLSDPAVQNVLIILVPPPLFNALAMFKDMLPIIQASDKPVVAVLMGDTHIKEAVQLLRSAHIPEYRFPESAAAALGALQQRGVYLKAHVETPPHFNDVLPGRVNQIISDEKNAAGGWLSGQDAGSILAAYGIPVPSQLLATSADQALSAAETMGLGADGRKFALKISSPDIPHKSDVGGVILNITSPQELVAGYERIMHQVRRSVPAAEIAGISIQQMVDPGQEVILGAVQDPQFGPLIMFGSGGVEVEGLKDIAFDIAPLTRIQARALMAATWAGRKLRGFRAIPPADDEAVLDILTRLARLALDFPQLGEIEINPLRVLSQGAFAIDTRIRLQQSESLPITGQPVDA